MQKKNRWDYILEHLLYNAHSWYGRMVEAEWYRPCTASTQYTLFSLKNRKGINYIAVEGPFYINKGSLIKISVIWNFILQISEMGEATSNGKAEGKVLYQRVPGHRPWAYSLNHNVFGCGDLGCTHFSHWFSMSEEAKILYCLQERPKYIEGYRRKYYPARIVKGWFYWENLARTTTIDKFQNQLKQNRVKA